MRGNNIGYDWQTGWLEAERQEVSLEFSCPRDRDRLVGWLKLVWRRLRWAGWDCRDFSGPAPPPATVRIDSTDSMEDLHIGQTSSWTEHWSQKPLQNMESVQRGHCKPGRVLTCGCRGRAWRWQDYQNREYRRSPSHSVASWLLTWEVSAGSPSPRETRQTPAVRGSVLVIILSRFASHLVKRLKLPVWGVDERSPAKVELCK